MAVVTYGDFDKESFIKVGKAVAQNVGDLCAMSGRDLYSFEHKLDFIIQDALILQAR